MDCVGGIMLRQRRADNLMSFMSPALHYLLTVCDTSGSVIPFINETLC